jgi:hypothetical protein
MSAFLIRGFKIVIASVLSSSLRAQRSNPEAALATNAALGCFAALAMTMKVRSQ